MPHGNSHRNKNPHHLYEIWDQQDEEIFKYGISDDLVEADGQSARLRDQLNLFNLIANFLRFVGKVLRTDILGRSEAERIENEHIAHYKQQYGKRPRGNPICRRPRG